MGSSESPPEKQLLFVAYDFPPGVGIGGAIRSANFARYLPESGWRPQVVSLDWGQARKQGVVRLKSWTPWHRPYELVPYGWAWALRRYLRKTREAYDLVYVSCPPFPHAMVVAKYAQKRRIPLVVDFRDAWSLDPYQEGSRLKRWLYRHVFPGMEERLISSVDHLILNTPSALRAYRDRYPAMAQRMSCLPNGFDSSAYPMALPVMDEPEMRLVYAGRFGIGARSPSNLLAGMRLAVEEGCRISMEIIGNQPSGIAQAVSGYDLDGVVTLVDQIPYEQAVSKMCNAGVLVLVQATSDASHQAVAGKTYDYLRTGRPVLYIGPPGDNRDLVDRYVGRSVCPADNPQSIAAALQTLYDEWQAGELAKPRLHPEVPLLFDRKLLTAQLADRLDSLLATGSR